MIHPLADTQEQLALLDPDAYECVPSTPGWSRTVPAGERWWLVNGWWLQAPGQPSLRWYHRRLDVREAIPLPGGSILAAHGTTRGFAVWCNPCRVMGRHHSAETKLAERLERLRTLPLRYCGTTVPAGGAVGQQPYASFPADFERGLILGTTSHDVAWTILKGGVTSGTNGANTLDELDDARSMRFAGATLFPFKRADWPIVRICSASVSGGGQCLWGDGGIIYVALPSDW